MRILESILTVCSLLLLAGIPSCSHPSDGRPDVVLITLDTTRWDHLSCYGSGTARTPNLDRIAERGILFTRAMTTAPVTLPAHASILTGLYPPGNGVRNNGMYRLSGAVPTMAGVLSREGYRTGAVVGSFVLDSQFGLDTGFEVYDDRIVDTETDRIFFTYLERSADAVTDAALSFIRDSGPEPLFLWVHYFDPHYPYEPPPPYDMKTPGGPYAGEVMYVDACVGRLIRNLEDLRSSRPLLTAVVGDHGEDLGDHGEMSHGVFLYESTVHVPFIISCPDLLPAGVRYDGLVSVVDIFPTVLDLLDVERENLHLQGISLAATGSLPPRRPVYLETLTPFENMGWSPLECVLSGDWKYIEAPAEELYNLSMDPGEEQNLAGSEVQVARAMKSTLDSVRAGISESTLDSGYEADRETLEKLARLGYVTGPARQGTRLADPKDMLSVLADQQKGLLLYDAGDYLAAEKAFGEALENDPTNVTLINYQALSLYNAGKPRDALAWWDRALHITPGYLDLFINVGMAYLAVNEPDSALAAYDAVLNVNPHYVKAMIGRGKAYRQKGQSERASEVLARILEVHPFNGEARFWMGVVRRERKDFEGAVKEFDLALAVSPGMKDAAREKAMTLVDLGRAGDAVAILEELTMQNPTDSELYLDLGYSEERDERTDAALKSYRRAAALDPLSPMAYNNIGAILDTKGQTGEAEEAFRKAISLDPGFPEAYYNLGFLLLELERVEEAQQVLTRFLDLWKREDEARRRVEKALGN